MLISSFHIVDEAHTPGQGKKKKKKSKMLLDSEQVLPPQDGHL